MPEGEEVTVPAPLMLTLKLAVAGFWTKVAAAETVPLTVTVQFPVPEQAPLQLSKLYPDAAAAVRVTFVPGTNALLQAPGQEIPGGIDVTVPLPVAVTCSRLAVGVMGRLPPATLPPPQPAIDNIAATATVVRTVE